MDWREKRLDIRLWWDDLKARRPRVAFVLAWGSPTLAALMFLSLLEYLDEVVVKGDELSFGTFTSVYAIIAGICAVYFLPECVGWIFKKFFPRNSKDGKGARKRPVPSLVGWFLDRHPIATFFLIIYLMYCPYLLFEMLFSPGVEFWFAVASFGSTTLAVFIIVISICCVIDVCKAGNKLALRNKAFAVWFPLLATAVIWLGVYILGWGASDIGIWALLFGWLNEHMVWGAVITFVAMVSFLNARAPILSGTRDTSNLKSDRSKREPEN